MKYGIVLKLFLLTTTLCLFITGTIYIGQTIFFKQYYENQKVNDLKSSIKSFEKQYLKSNGNVQSIQQLEQDFYRTNNTWITTLDKKGNIISSNDYYVKIKINDEKNSNQFVTIPLYHLLKGEDVFKDTPTITMGEEVDLYTIEKNNIILPFYLYSVQNDSDWLNQFIWTRIDNELQMNSKELKEYNLHEKITISIKYQNQYHPNFRINQFKGIVQNVRFPEQNDVSSIIYSNSFFMERISDFQTGLLFNEQNQFTTFTTDNYDTNGIKYKLFIDPVKDKNGNISYIFAMASLQPVDEAAQMVNDYFIYMIAFVLLLTILASFYYSIKIARPLLKINNSTRKIAGLDFSERIEYFSKDEIGDISQNINLLSDTLHSHITQLQQDIEKEKQLENTRKEFISGVSHELKTPLSIMKGCISILKDGVASHKKDYYFEAMEKEVDKMDRLIIDMLELAKYESGTYKMKMESFYLDKVIEHICHQLHLEIEKTQLTIHKELTSIKVLANQHLIEQVITNYITNAIRYTPLNEHIYISTIVENEQVKVCVENKGSHIPGDQLEKVWERFYRGDMSRRRSEGSTGLGLAISKNILDLHGLQYGVMNTSDGVLFYFYLNMNR
ncbi:ATP-binding protein [Viridibacillus sp. FSL R5-0477]|uniref:histidine kinase n=1 Tax=Viridibacillus arenosi FSL R5-213 TaxID=1227360 RepID=W4F1D3_9BACL|nr:MULTISPECIES: HAMP domain-containing sensor histidine kinase [Viridibacillus]ETT86575.1 two component system histidine kinase [Viridibacillus arenosi FSL R5-213]OMC84551.1 two-component sensor histidine kinase [Viridibacillus sp. FSL H8-0123]OMC85971.1 two-component sensor histidine kinase [Viridibacillus sp. FSL H7-0596]OMC91600.1 two-component sensor histidine kinase [Viridibacillus arenosi]